MSTRTNIVSIQCSSDTSLQPTVGRHSLGNLEPKQIVLLIFVFLILLYHGFLPLHQVSHWIPESNSVPHHAVQLRVISRASKRLGTLSPHVFQCFRLVFGLLDTSSPLHLALNLGFLFLLSLAPICELAVDICDPFARGISYDRLCSPSALLSIHSFELFTLSILLCFDLVRHFLRFYQPRARVWFVMPLYNHCSTCCRASCSIIWESSPLPWRRQVSIVGRSVVRPFPTRR
mmetsp:Transcript_10450/g.38500  ORF Transcript_10450/g.38500 Transcript_10450/m.38500 type:complete len:232 (-) Transcript_10450:594-1289(-)